MLSLFGSISATAHFDSTLAYVNPSDADASAPCQGVQSGLLTYYKNNFVLLHSGVFATSKVVRTPELF